MILKKTRGQILFSRFKRGAQRRVFLDPLESRVEHKSAKKVDIILSPALYWVKKVSLPVKYLRDVKKLLPSLFEDILPEGIYSYSAYKSGEDFFIFAYEDKKIIDLLAQYGINIADISSLYFAQNFASSLKKPLSINGMQALYVKDEILLVAPLSWFDTLEPLDIQGVTLINHTITLQQFGHIINNSSLYKIAATLASLALIVGVEIFITQAKSESILEAKDKLFANYKLQSTMMQNRSTLAKYEKIHKLQSDLREYISYFLKMRLAKGEKIEVMEYKNGVLSVVISEVNKSNSQAISRYLKSKGLKFSDSYSSAGMRVEVKL